MEGQREVVPSKDGGEIKSDEDGINYLEERLLKQIESKLKKPKTG